MWNVHHIAVGLPLLTGLFVAGQEPCVAREPAPTPMKTTWLSPPVPGQKWSKPCDNNLKTKT